MGEKCVFVGNYAIFTPYYRLSITFRIPSLIGGGDSAGMLEKLTRSRPLLFPVATEMLDLPYVFLFLTSGEILEPNVEAEDTDEFSDFIPDRSGDGDT